MIVSKLVVALKEYVSYCGNITQFLYPTYSIIRFTKINENQEIVWSHVLIVVVVVVAVGIVVVNTLVIIAGILMQPTSETPNESIIIV